MRAIQQSLCLIMILCNPTARKAKSVFRDHLAFLRWGISQVSWRLLDRSFVGSWKRASVFWADQNKALFTQSLLPVYGCLHYHLMGLSVCHKFR